MRTPLSCSVWLSSRAVRRKLDSHRWQLMQAQQQRAPYMQVSEVHMQTLNESGGAA